MIWVLAAHPSNGGRPRHGQVSYMGYDTSGDSSPGSLLIAPIVLVSRIFGDIQYLQTVDRNSSYFLDVGAWQGGRSGNPTTTFGLVCQHHILLCSWLNRSEGGVTIDTLP